MPNIWTYGFPNQVDYGTGALMCEQCNYRPFGHHAAITGTNGIGKTSTALEPLLQLVHPRKNQGDSGKGRLSPAAFMKAVGQKVPWIVYCDLLIDNDPAASPEAGNDMALWGMVLDSSNLGSDPSNPVANGFQFLLYHSSAIYADDGESRPPYVLLGIDFYERDPFDPSRVKPLDYQSIRQKVNAKVDDSLGSFFARMRNGYVSKADRKRIGDALGWDLELMDCSSSVLSTKEGIAGLLSLSNEQFNEKLIYPPLENRYLDEESTANLKKNLSDYVLSNALQLDMERQSKCCNALRAAFFRAKEPIGAYSAAVENLNDKRAAAGIALRGAQDRISSLENAQAGFRDQASRARAEIVAAEKRKLSRRFHAKLDELAHARADYIAACAAKDKAQGAYDWTTRELHAVGIRIAKNDLGNAEARALAARSAFEAKAKGLESQELNDLAFTLHRLHEQRCESAEREESLAENTLNDANAALRALEHALEEARSAEAHAKAKLESLEDNKRNSYKKCKAAAAAAGLERFCNDQLSTCSLQEISAAASRAKEASAAAEALASRQKDNLEKAQQAVEEAVQSEAQRKSDAAIAADKAQKEASSFNAYKAALEQLANQTGLNERIPIETLGGCLELINSWDVEIDQANKRISDISDAIGAEQRLLEAARSKKLHVPPEALRAIDEAGAEPEPAEVYLTSMDPAVRNELLARCPWAACAVIVPDGLQDTAKEACARLDDAWFSGAVPILTRDQIRDASRIEPAALAACPNSSYIEDPDAFIEALSQHLSDDEDLLRKIEREAGRLEDNVRKTEKFAASFYQSGRESMGSWKRFSADAETSARTAAEALAEASRGLEAAKGKKEAASEALKTAEGDLQAAKAAASAAAAAEEAASDLVQSDKLLTPAKEAVSKHADKLQSAREAADRARARQNNARDALSQARQRKKDISLEVSAIPRPAEGKQVEGGFDELLASHELLSRTLNADLEPLKRELTKAEQDRLAKRAALQTALAAAQKEGANPKEPPEGLATEEAFADLSKNLPRREGERDAARAAAEQARKRYNHTMEERDQIEKDYQSDYDSDPLPLPECSFGDPDADIRVAKKQQMKAEESCSQADESMYKLNSLAGKLEAAGIAPAEQPAPEESEEGTVSRLQSAYRELKDSESKLRKATDKALSAVSSIEGSIADQPIDFKAEQVSCVQLAHAINQHDPSKAEKIRFHQEQSLSAQYMAIESKIKAKENQLDSSARVLAQIAAKMCSSLRTLCKRSHGEFRIRGLEGIKTAPEPLEQHISNWLVAETKALMRTVRDAPAINREETVRKAIVDRVLNSRAVLAQLFAASGRSGQIVPEFQSRRYGESGKWQTWQETTGMSGGEKVSAILAAVITLYSATETSEGAQSRKGWTMLLLDTPFGGLSNNEMCSKVFDSADRNHVQLVVVEDKFPDGVLGNFGYQAALHAAHFGDVRAARATESAVSRDILLAYFQDKGVASQPSLFS